MSTWRTQTHPKDSAHIKSATQPSQSYSCDREWPATMSDFPDTTARFSPARFRMSLLPASPARSRVLTDQWRNALAYAASLRHQHRTPAVQLAACRDGRSSSLTALRRALAQAGLHRTRTVSETHRSILWRSADPLVRHLQARFLSCPIERLPAPDAWGSFLNLRSHPQRGNRLRRI
jgi:hypothetical protein